MKLAVVSHSAIHIRQQQFFKLLSEQEGVDVTLFCPDEWGELKAQPALFATTKFRIKSLSAVGTWPPHPDQFTLIGLEDLLRQGHYDWVYIQQEPGAALVKQALECLDGTPAKKALFTWENIEQNLGEDARRRLQAFDLVVCGNDDSQAIVNQVNKNTVILPQVGVDTDHFQARPGVQRHISVGYVGRMAAEKGVEELLEAWPTARCLEWQSYPSLPWWYSQMQMVVCYSQDTPFWREQAMPFVSVEALSCGVWPVLSDAGSIPFWHRKFAREPTWVPLVPQDDIAALRNMISYWLDPEHIRDRLQEVLAGKEWVEKYLSSRVIAKRLMEAFDGV